MYSFDELTQKSRPELVSLGATMGIDRVTSMSKQELVNEIVLRKQAIQRNIEQPPLQTEQNPSDDRLRTRPPAKAATQAEVIEMCQPYIDRGLIITFPEEDQWYMRFNEIEESGTIRQPLRVIVQRAQLLSRSTEGTNHA